MVRDEQSAQQGPQLPLLARSAYKTKTATRVFKTLRDMAESMTIDFEELEFVETLGGAL